MSEKPLGIGSLADSSSDFWSDGSNMIQCCWCCPSSLAKLVKKTPKLGFLVDILDISIPGWWYTYPSEQYESQLGCLFPIYGKMKNVPNHHVFPRFQAAYRLRIGARCVTALDVQTAQLLCQFQSHGARLGCQRQAFQS